MIRRTLDAAFLNEVANDPAVRPGLGGEGELDLSNMVADPTAYALVCDCGGFILSRLAPGHYEVHSMFLPGKGTEPIRAMREAQEWMFTRTDCVSLWSKLPKSNASAKGFAIAGGLLSVFERNHERLGDTEFAELALMRWAMACKALEPHGERFHDLLETTKAESGSSLPKHADDPAHERAVGAALLMFERGQPHKAAAFYNLWAGFAGYAQITLISDAPITVDTGDAILGMGTQGMEVLTCR